jgi:DNA ligase-1
MMVRETLYKLDSKGKVREWRMEIEGAKFRTVSGLADGKQVISEWKQTHAKNVGRANATTAEEQAVAEVDALYTKRLDGEYHTSVKDVSKARFFKPMLAAKWEDRLNKVEYPVYVQPKLDGVRCIANSDGLWTRTGKQIVSCPHIEIALEPLFETDPDLVLDGELYNHKLRDDFNQIISLVRKTKPTDEDLADSKNMVEFHVYDLPSCDDIYSVRRTELEQVLRYEDSCLEFVQTDFATSQKDVDGLFGQYVEQGYEGGIIRLDMPYEQKRSNSLLKRKDFEDAEFEIISVEEGQGNWSGYAKTLFIKLPDGTVQQSGLAGNQDYLRQVLADREAYRGGEATVQYFTKTPDGKLRFPVAKALFKNSRDV